MCGRFLESKPCQVIDIEYPDRSSLTQDEQKGIKSVLVELKPGLTAAKLLKIVNTLSQAR